MLLLIVVFGFVGNVDDVCSVWWYGVVVVLMSDSVWWNFDLLV